MDIAEWLHGIGLQQYGQTFRDNAIEVSLLPDLTDQHLKQLGLPLGHRLKLLRAIATLRDAAAPVAPRPVETTLTTAAALSPGGCLQLRAHVRDSEPERRVAPRLVAAHFPEYECGLHSPRV